MIDRRSSKRFKRSLPLTFSNAVGEHRGVSLDFSVSALFILTRDPFRPGTKVEIRLEVSNREMIRLSGVVVRAIRTGDINIKDGMGIQLVEVPYIYHKFLKRLEKE